MFYQDANRPDPQADPDVVRPEADLPEPEDGPRHVEPTDGAGHDGGEDVVLWLML